MSTSNVPPLGCGEIHVWSFALDRQADELEELSRVLTPGERERAARFHFPHLRNRAVVARGILRHLLSEYLKLDPARVSFELGAYGKPYVPSTPIHFNLAHSAGWGLCAVALGTAVGADIEHIRDDLDHDGLARSCFSAAERAQLATYPASLTLRGFFRCWTFKEAYVKGRGGGLSIPLDIFDVPLALDSEEHLVTSRDSSPDAAGWFVRDLRIRPQVAAALAVRRPGCSVRYLTC